ncbi:MAG: hypothetical protein ACRKFN_12140 [Desulfitobacterium sp.]
MEANKICVFCNKGGQLIHSSEQNCDVHSQCIVSNLGKDNQVAIAIAKEFDMIPNYSQCGSGCENCKDRWCGR